MEQGPVLLVTFQTQQIMVVYDKLGKVVEGDPVCTGISPALLSDGVDLFNNL